MKKYFIICLSLTTFSTLTIAQTAQSDKRASHIGASGGFGSSNYSSANLDAALGIDSRWQLNTGVASSTSAGSTTSSGKLGASAEATEALEVHAQGQASNEVNELKGRGILAGASYDLDSLWEGERAFTVNLDFEANRFTQGTVANSLLRTNAFRQRAWHIEFSQELSEAFTLAEHGSSYTYTGRSANINAAVNARRARISTANKDLISGFPKNSVGIDLSWQCAEKTALKLGASQAVTIETEIKTHSQNLGVEQKINTDWTVSAAYTRSKPTNDLASDAGELGISYSF